MEDMILRLWLGERLRIANEKMTGLLDMFGGVEGIYLSKSFNNINGLSKREKELLLDKDLARVEKILEEMTRIGGKIILYGDENYPKILRDIHRPPSVLYIKGKVPDLDSVLTIGVVGTRRSGEYGNIVTKRICADLASAGTVTVSGLASGIDAVGAWATIDEGSIAVGVIGSGLDYVYPGENAELYKAIARKGCIISEFPPGTPIARAHFPMRNRIIAGLSRGVLVTEAPKSSGSLITARIAIDEGRDVFAVPGNITESRYAGTNMLIQQGAKLVMSADDILSEYPYAKQVAPYKERSIPVKEKKGGQSPEKDSTKKTAKINGLNEKETAIAKLLERKNMEIDEIARMLGITAGEANTRLVMLEMKGVVSKLPGSAYKLNVW